MSDPLLAAVWVAVCAGGLGVAAGLRRAGVAATHARDLLHIGAGVWAFGLAGWAAPWWPRGITLAAFGAAGLVAVGANRARAATRVRDALCGPGERWAGVVAYTAAFAAATWLGTAWAPVPAAAAMLAVAWGDGAGGLVGQRWGRHRYRLPWAKPKSWEGTAVVALGAAAGTVAAGAWYGAAVPWWVAGAAGCVAAGAEALAPRASDNLLVPAAVWLVVQGAAALELR